MILRADAGPVTDLQAVNKEVSEVFGELDIFFANVGIAYGTPPAEIFHQLSGQATALACASFHDYSGRSRETTE